MGMEVGLSPKAQESGNGVFFFFYSCTLVENSSTMRIGFIIIFSVNHAPCQAVRHLNDTGFSHSLNNI